MPAKKVVGNKDYKGLRCSSINILGKHYSIAYTDSIPVLEEEAENGIDYILGLTHNDKKLIEVLEGMDKNEEGDTTLHEVLHAIDFVFDLNLTERQIKVLSSALINVLNTNPNFREYINEIAS
jgi:predicted DNA binding protein